MYKISVYVPSAHLAAVKKALFEAGAGRFTHYDQVCWQVLGEGQFRPLEQANPTEGKVGELTSLPEYRLEMLCEPDRIINAITALKAAHPYEAPAYDVLALLDF